MWDIGDWWNRGEAYGASRPAGHSRHPPPAASCAPGFAFRSIRGPLGRSPEHPIAALRLTRSVGLWSMHAENFSSRYFWWVRQQFSKMLGNDGTHNVRGILRMLARIEYT